MGTVRTGIVRPGPSRHGWDPKTAAVGAGGFWEGWNFAKQFAIIHNYILSPTPCFHHGEHGALAPSQGVAVLSVMTSLSCLRRDLMRRSEACNYFVFWARHLALIQHQ